MPFCRLSHSLEKLTYHGCCEGIERIPYKHAFPNLVYLAIPARIEAERVLEFLRVFGSSLLRVSCDISTKNVQIWDDFCRDVVTHYPKLERFVDFRCTPLENHCVLLRHFGAQVTTANFVENDFRGNMDLCQQALEACPNPEVPSYFPRGLDDLQIVAPRLNGFLGLAEFSSVDIAKAATLKACFQKCSMFFMPR